MATHASPPRIINVFIASPGDLAVERAAFKEVIDEVNHGFAAGAGVRFEVLAWEDVISPMGLRPQSEINKDVDRCDVFFLAMYRRWGQNAPDLTPPATSYTEEEFNLAFDRFKKTGKPLIHIFFKNIDTEFLKDPGPQLAQVLAFKRRVEESRQALPVSFADEAEFRNQIVRHLRAIALPKPAGDAVVPQQPTTAAPVDLPTDQLKELQQDLAAVIGRLKQAETELEQLKSRDARKPKPLGEAAVWQKKEQDQATAKVAVALAEKDALKLAKQAARAALEGRIEEARQDFAKATEGTSNLRVLYLAYEFYNRWGDLATAAEMLERWFATSGRDAETANTAAAFGNLGAMYRIRGELDRAEEMLKKSLAIEEKLGRQAVLATDYCNLGLFYQVRGKLDRAEEMLKKSLAINEKLYRQEGMAADYGNLGLIYKTRGELDRAEEMHRKALAINEELGRQEGIASEYANLGTVTKQRGNFAGARELWTKARDLFAKIGMPHMVKQVQGWLDELPGK